MTFVFCFFAPHFFRRRTYLEILFVQLFATDINIELTREVLPTRKVLLTRQALDVCPTTAPVSVCCKGYNRKTSGNLSEARPTLEATR